MPVCSEGRRRREQADALPDGVNPAYIARQLGHANTAMLFKHYSKWIDGVDAGREKAKLNNVFGANSAHSYIESGDWISRSTSKLLKMLIYRLVALAELEIK